jgi:hypothetical protein
MGFLSRIRDAISGPPQVQYGSGDEGASAVAGLDEDLPAAASDEAELERAQEPETHWGGALEREPGVGAFEEAETEAADDTPDKS